MLRLAFSIPMVPVAWARAGARGALRFTPERAAKAKKTVRDYAREAMQRRQASVNPMALVARFTFPVPDSWPKWKRVAAFERRLLHTSKPDLDNLTKLLKDAMNGVVYVDDCQIVKLEARKDWGGAGRVEIEVAELAA